MRRLIGRRGSRRDTNAKKLGDQLEEYRKARATSRTEANKACSATHHNGRDSELASEELARRLQEEFDLEAATRLAEHQKVRALYG